MKSEREVGQTVTRSWVIGQQGVNAFQRRCLELSWIFQETSQQSDFGKDGYLDFAPRSVVTGPCIAVQIKGGRSMKRGGGYTLKVSKSQRRFWEMSTVPVFGIVWDPDEDALFWCDISGKLRTDGLEAKLFAPNTQELNTAEGANAFLEYAIASTIAGPIALALASEDKFLQIAAVEDTLAWGRQDPRYFILLRRVMFGLHPHALDHAIYVLGKLTLNYDVLADKLWIGQENCTALRSHFKWTVSEVVALLDRIEDDGIYRGTFGQNIYWLIVGDDNWDFISIVEQAVVLAVEMGRTTAAAWGLIISVFWAEKRGEAKLAELLERQPKLQSIWSVDQIREELKQNGEIDLSG